MTGRQKGRMGRRRVSTLPFVGLHRVPTLQGRVRTAEQHKVRAAGTKPTNAYFLRAMKSHWVFEAST